MERERVKEPDTDQISDYEKSMRHYQEWADRQKSGELLIRGDKRDYQVSRQGFIKYYMNALFTDTALSSWAVFEHLIKNQSGRHKHQGGIIIYALEVQGSTEVNGEVLEWKAGDLLLLPIQPSGCTHQHWNRDTSKGCRWVAFNDLLVSRTIANAIEQVSEMPDRRGRNRKGSRYHPISRQLVQLQLRNSTNWRDLCTPKYFANPDPGARFLGISAGVGMR